MGLSDSIVSDVISVVNTFAMDDKNTGTDSNNSETLFNFQNDSYTLKTLAFPVRGCIDTRRSMESGVAGYQLQLSLSGRCRLPLSDVTGQKFRRVAGVVFAPGARRQPIRLPGTVGIT